MRLCLSPPGTIWFKGGSNHHGAFTFTTTSHAAQFKPTPTVKVTLIAIIAYTVRDLCDISGRLHTRISLDQTLIISTNTID